MRTFGGTLSIEYHTLTRCQPAKIIPKSDSEPVFSVFDNSEKIENPNEPRGYQKSEVREKKLGINWKSDEIFKFQFLSKSVENFKS